MENRLPRLLLAGTSSGCGKTTLTCGILQALGRRRLKLASFKCGPDYIDPMFHSQVLGVPCRNLDLQLFPAETLRCLLAENGAGADLCLIEGVMGYYDGVGLTEQASSYEIAWQTRTPAVLVINARGAAHSLLAVIQGFCTLHPDSGIAGVLFNNCSAGLYPRLAEAVMARFSGRVRPLGYLPKMADCRLESRHLGLVTAAEIDDLHRILDLLADQVERSVDLEGLLELSRQAPPLSWQRPCLPQPGPLVRIAVARDRAFCFYYEDNLSLLEQLGGQLRPFSPLEDERLPENIQGLYLGGGYPELYASQLAANASMRASIRAALESGLPCIAECGGFLYLLQRLCGEEMVGFLPGEGFDTGKLVRFGYVTLTARQDNLLCRAGEQLPAHEFHYYDAQDPGSTFLAAKANGRSWDCAWAGPSLYAGFPHFHFYSRPEMAQRFLNACRKEQHRHD